MSAREAALQSIRRHLIEALVAEGADPTFATGYVELHVHFSTLTDGQALAELGPHHCGDDPAQLRWLARVMQSEDPDADLGSPTPPTTTPPQSDAGARAREASPHAGTF